MAKFYKIGKHWINPEWVRRVGDSHDDGRRLHGHCLVYIDPDEYGYIQVKLPAEVVVLMLKGCSEEAARKILKERLEGDDE